MGGCWKTMSKMLDVKNIDVYYGGIHALHDIRYNTTLDDEEDDEQFQDND